MGLNFLPHYNIITNRNGNTKNHTKKKSRGTNIQGALFLAFLHKDEEITLHVSTPYHSCVPFGIAIPIPNLLLQY